VFYTNSRYQTLTINKTIGRIRDMNKHLYGLILLTSLSFTNNSAFAEVYRWVDEQGNIHFGDKAPANNKAKDISQGLQQQNLDHSAKRTQQSLQQIDLRQQAQTTEVQQKQSQTNSGAAQRERQCHEAQRQLRILQGPVVFLDENKQPVKVSEKERQQRADAFAKQVNKYCR